MAVPRLAKESSLAVAGSLEVRASTVSFSISRRPPFIHETSDKREAAASVSVSVCVTVRAGGRKKGQKPPAALQPRTTVQRERRTPRTAPRHASRTIHRIKDGWE